MYIHDSKEDDIGRGDDPGNLERVMTVARSQEKEKGSL